MNGATYPIADCLTSLNQHDNDESRIERFASWVTEVGGSFPRLSENTHALFEVSLLEVTGMGSNEAEAIRGWMKAASRKLETQKRLDTARAIIHGAIDPDDETLKEQIECLRNFGNANDYATAELARRAIQATA
jgi:hypothetical protein